jgi:hypothetical protein
VKLSNKFDIEAIEKMYDENSEKGYKDTTRKPYLTDETWDEIQKHREAKNILNALNSDASEQVNAI